jgi:hypothetical protein
VKSYSSGIECVVQTTETFYCRSDHLFYGSFVGDVDCDGNGLISGTDCNVLTFLSGIDGCGFVDIGKDNTPGTFSGES